MEEGAEAEGALGTFVRSELTESRRRITLQWIDELRHRLGIRPARLLPTDALEDHVPKVIEAVATRLSLAESPLGSVVTDDLRLLARFRREQGYDISEILEELGSLSRLLSVEVRRALGRFPGTATVEESAEVISRLHFVLEDVERIVVGAFREEEAEEQRELSSRMQDFAQTLAHEIKNPLNAALQSARLLQDDAGEYPPDQRSRLAKVLFRSLERIGDLVDGLLALAGAESARSDAQWRRLPEVVEEVFRQLEEPAEAAGVRLVTRSELPEIYVDARRIEIALHNLVLNGIKYSDPAKDDRWVELSAFHVEKATGEGGEWRLSVRDNGRGIPEQMQDRVFQRHVRAHPEAAEGTGLGLSITRQVVEKRGGRVLLESSEGVGSAFHIVLPDRPGRDESPQADG